MDPIAVGNVLEVCMLLAFASAWPFNISKAYKARTAVGTSPVFMIAIELGYACGMASKVITDDITFVFAFYMLDFFLVLVGLSVYARNVRLDAQAGINRGNTGTVFARNQRSRCVL